MDSPTLDSKERPGSGDGTPGPILPSARCIGWLQEGLDYMHTRYPFGSTLLSTTITWVAGQKRYSLPSDYIQDYKNGIVHADDELRMERRGMAHLLNYPSATESQWGKPFYYCVVGSEIEVRPVPSAPWAGKTATLLYYGLPTPLGPTTVPKFPSDIVLVRYVYLRGLEWTRAVEPGTAEKYLMGIVADLQGQGIGNEAEEDSVSLDRTAFPGVRIGPFAWMGPTTVQE